MPLKIDAIWVKFTSYVEQLSHNLWRLRLQEKTFKKRAYIKNLQEKSVLLIKNPATHVYLWSRTYKWTAVIAYQQDPFACSVPRDLRASYLKKLFLLSFERENVLTFIISLVIFKVRNSKTRRGLRKLVLYPPPRLPSPFPLLRNLGFVWRTTRVSCLCYEVFR